MDPTLQNGQGTMTWESWQAIPRSSKVKQFRSNTAVYLPRVGAGDRGRGGRAGGEDLVALLDVDDSSAGRANRAGRRGRGRAGEGDSAEVSEGNEAAVGLEVLNDPLGIVLAERGLAGEGVGDGRALRVVLDGGSAAGLGGGLHGGGDGVASREADAREVVGVVGVPLIPGYM